MAHSFIYGRHLHFEVRDAICEAILQKLLAELIKADAPQGARDLVAEWYDYWYSTPPGCKNLNLTCPSSELELLIRGAADSVACSLPSDGELARVAGQIVMVLEDRQEEARSE